MAHNSKHGHGHGHGRDDDRGHGHDDHDHGHGISKISGKIEKKSKILIIGSTGYFGKFVVEASAKLGNPTFAFVRESAFSIPAKAQLIEKFKSLGVTIVQGDLYDHESLVNAIKQVDVVISALGAFQILDQQNLVVAIKEAGNVKRFLPSEFGNDVDRVDPVEPAVSSFTDKAKIRRSIEAEGIPYTYVVANCFAGSLLSNLCQPTGKTPPRDKVIIPVDGNIKAIYCEENDAAKCTIKAVDDPRTLNKILYINPRKNTITFNELVAIWEKKIGKTLEKEFVSVEQYMKNIQEAPIPLNIVLAIRHSIFVNGDQTNFEIKPSFGVESPKLYPDIKYISVKDYLDQFV